MNFVAIDVELANPDMASICQIGIVEYNNGNLVREWKTYIDPEDYFHNYNIMITGINESTVKGSPTFKDVNNDLLDLLNNKIIACHTYFDRVSINRSCEKYNTLKPDCIWLDTSLVVRRTWEDLSYKGFGLANVSKKIGYDFNHHDALEDAKAAAHVLLTAIDVSGITLNDWLKRVKQPLKGYEDRKHKREGNPDGFLCGDNLVFTGTLAISRRELADMASEIGCNVQAGVNKQTSLLVVGDQDISRLAGKDKSNKHIKAEELIEKGQDIRIIGEKDFFNLVETSKIN
jgi:DNA polymerase III subunit epsilon